MRGKWISNWSFSSMMNQTHLHLGYFVFSEKHADAVFLVQNHVDDIRGHK